MQRNVLLQALEEELPAGTIRYNSRIVSIDDDKEKDGGGDAKILHLADGSTLRAKVLIGCDGINSVVARWLGLAKPSHSGRSATRGLARYPRRPWLPAQVLAGRRGLGTWAAERLVVARRHDGACDAALAHRSGAKNAMLAAR